MDKQVRLFCGQFAHDNSPFNCDGFERRFVTLLHFHVFTKNRSRNVQRSIARLWAVYPIVVKSTRLGQMPTFLHCGLRPMLQENSEPDSVRNQVQWHHQGGKEECGSQLSCQKSRMTRLVESVDQIG